MHPEYSLLHAQDTQVLKGIDLSMEMGQVVSIIGSSFFASSSCLIFGIRSTLPVSLISSRIILYTVEARGTPKSIPIIPKTPPPTVTAARTQRLGSPIEDPTTLG